MDKLISTSIILVIVASMLLSSGCCCNMPGKYIISNSSENNSDHHTSSGMTSMSSRNTTGFYPPPEDEMNRYSPVSYNDLMYSNAQYLKYAQGNYNGVIIRGKVLHAEVKEMPLGHKQYILVSMDFSKNQIVFVEWLDTDRDGNEIAEVREGDNVTVYGVVQGIASGQLDVLGDSSIKMPYVFGDYITLE